MSKISKEYCRVTVLMLLVISLIIPPVAVSAYDGPIVAVKKTDAALRTKITGAWMNESIDKVLMDLADQASVDIIKGPKVTGNVTAKITGVPLAEALTNILAAHGFTYVATDNMIRVTTLSTMDLAMVKEELVSKVYRITYADANDVAGSLAGFVSDKGKVAFNRGTSHIIVTDTEKKMKAVDKFIAELDRQTQQVLVEVKIYEIKTSEGFDLGSAFYAARNIEYETHGTMNPTTTTTTVSPGYDIVTDQTTPDIITETYAPGYSTETIEGRTESIPQTTTTTFTPLYTTNTTETNTGLSAPGEADYLSEWGQTFVGTEQTLWEEYINRQDTSSTSTVDPVTGLPVTGFETITTTNTGDDYSRTDTTGQTFSPVSTTETTYGGTATTTERVPGVSTTETTTYQSPTGYYTPKRGKPFYGASFDPQRGGSLSFSLLNDAVDFEFVLSALKKEVESKLLANPRILVLDNETANFKIVKEIPYRELLQVAREDPLSYTAFKNVGVQLEVTPHVARGGLIKLKIAPEFSILLGQDIYGVPTVDARRADTVALIRDGQTIAIGGLRKRETSKSISKVPLLGDIPLLGHFFKSSSESVQINELVVLITPRIINSMDPTPAELSEYGDNGIPKVFRKDNKPKPQNNNQGKVLESSDNDLQPAEQGQEIELQMAYGYLKMGRFDRAKDTLGSVIAAQPNNGTAHQYLGYCHLKSGDLDAAMQSYLTAVDLNGADFEAHRGLGVAYMLKARSDGGPDFAARAVEQWQTSLDINPDQTNGPALRQMIEAYTQ